MPCPAALASRPLFGLFLGSGGQLQDWEWVAELVAKVKTPAAPFQAVLQGEWHLGKVVQLAECLFPLLKWASPAAVPAPVTASWLVDWNCEHPLGLDHQAPYASPRPADLESEQLCVVRGDGVLFGKTYPTCKLGSSRSAARGDVLLPVHRFLCQLKWGPAPAARPYVCHCCPNTCCVNPLHLRWDMQEANYQDGVKHNSKKARLIAAAANARAHKLARQQ